MRSYPLLFLSLLFLSLLTACGSGPTSGPRVDFIGTSRFTTSDRLLTTPGDTITSFLYADNRGENNPLLKRFRITVNYEPGPGPIYHVQGRGTAPGNLEITYLDSALSLNEFVFLHQFSSRTTSGRETWRFEAEDAGNDKAGRSYILTTRRADSTAFIQTYSVLLQAPASRAGARRSYLDARDGLTFAGYSAASNPSVQALVDLVYVPIANGGFSLASPNDPTAQARLNISTAAWPNARKTEVRLTNLTAAQFAEQNTEQLLFSGFNDAPLSSANITASLAEKKVVAFNTADGRKGLILVDDILDTAIPTVRLQVRVTKRQFPQ